MLLSLKWLREFVPFEGSAYQLGDKLTMLGLELEAIVHPYENINSIIVGHVLNCEKHPEADKLSVCSVDIGEQEPLSIVCGAPNIGSNQKVAVAPVGTTMPDGLVIKKAKLRGVPSFGMICSERELHLSDSHEGIMILPENFKPGQKLVEALNLDAELCEIGITPNRGDCLSVLGLAREVALAYNLPLTLPEFNLTEFAGDINQELKITIENPNLCFAYGGRIIEDVKVKPTPARLRYRLKAMGLRSISNIVDVTNYILLELGQPLHAFDLKHVYGNEIIIKTAKQGQKFITLDQIERTLNEQDQLICDQEKAIALAGVMGGANSEISEQTQRIFLESAIFNPATVRKTSKRLNLSSDSSYRFERGVDQQGYIYALNKAAFLIAEFGEGKIRKGICQNEPKPWLSPKIYFRPSQVNKLLGLKLEPDFCVETLIQLGCKLESPNADGLNQESKSNSNTTNHHSLTLTDPAEIVDSALMANLNKTNQNISWTVTSPSYRLDLSREVDLIEEIGRVYGLDRIPITLPQVEQSLNSDYQNSKYHFWAKIKTWACGLGLNESINYSFVGENDLNLLSLNKENRLYILNPLSTEQNVLRTELAPGLLNNLKHNLAHGNTGLKLFELAHVFSFDPDSETKTFEQSHLGILLYGDIDDQSQKEQEADYQDIKGIIEHLLNTLNLQEVRFTISEQFDFILPCVQILHEKKLLGYIGKIKQEIADFYHARKAVWLADINLDKLYELNQNRYIKFQELDLFPPVRRDITIMADKILKIETVLTKIKSLSLPLLQTITFIDIFEPENSLEKNLTFRLTFRHKQRTLKDIEADKEREKIAQILIKDLGVRI